MTRTELELGLRVKSIIKPRLASFFLCLKRETFPDGKGIRHSRNKAVWHLCIGMGPRVMCARVGLAKIVYEWGLGSMVGYVGRKN